MELKEIQKNMIYKIPKIMEYSIGNFGQLSSINKFKDIQNILERINTIWQTGLLFSETKEEFLESNSLEIFEKFFSLLNIVNNDIDNLFENVEQKFSPTLESRKIDLALADFEENPEKTIVDTRFDDGTVNILKIDTDDWN